jgi:release factor glutamine methyltransferase
LNSKSDIIAPLFKPEGNCEGDNSCSPLVSLRLDRRVHINSKNFEAHEHRLLLGYILNQSPEWVFMHLPTLILSEDQNHKLDELVSRRLNGEPIAKILGYKEFYGRRFFTNAYTLDPRPDSETLIEAVLKYFLTDKPHQILDLGLGTGCLLFTLLAELPHAYGVGVDYSWDALMVAKKNQEHLNLTNRSSLLQSNWAAALQGSFDIIVSNPPYIATSEQLDASTLHDPNLALFSGKTGMEAYAQILPQLSPLLKPGGKVFLEIGKGQELCVENIAMAASLKSESTFTDLSGTVRVLCYSANNA